MAESFRIERKSADAAPGGVSQGMTQAHGALRFRQVELRAQNLHQSWIERGESGLPFTPTKAGASGRALVGQSRNNRRTSCSTPAGTGPCGLFALAGDRDVDAPARAQGRSLNLEGRATRRCADRSVKGQMPSTAASAASTQGRAFFAARRPDPTDALAGQIASEFRSVLGVLGAPE